MTQHHLPASATAKGTDYSLLSPDNFGNKPELAMQLAEHLDNVKIGRGSYLANFALDAPVAEQPVRVLQAYLTQHGHPELQVDGLMGQKTREAMQKFLKANTGYDGPVDGSPLNSHALDSLSVGLSNNKRMFGDYLPLPPGTHDPSADEMKELARKYPEEMKQQARQFPKAMKALELEQQGITPSRPPDTPGPLATALSKDDLERHMPRSSLRAEQSLSVVGQRSHQPAAILNTPHNLHGRLPSTGGKAPTDVSPMYVPPF